MCISIFLSPLLFFFFFNDTAPTEIYTLSLHDALPIFKIEVWLPVLGWNGKFQAVGNGGWAGSISYDAMAFALQEGYATASTDTGHTGGNATFAIGHPEKVMDFAYRAVHEMAVKSEAII